MNPTYIGDIDLNEETLAHYGIKGMKWHIRKAKNKILGLRRKRKPDTNRARSLAQNRYNEKQEKRKEKNIADHIAEDISKGKRTAMLRKINGDSSYINNKSGTFTYGDEVFTYTHKNIERDTPNGIGMYVGSEHKGTTMNQYRKSRKAYANKKKTSTRPKWGNRQY